MKKLIKILICFMLFICFFSSTEKYEATSAEEQKERLKEIYTELYPSGESYFTVNGKPCTHVYNKSDGCSNCSLSNILTTLNTKNSAKFGTAYQLYNSSQYNGWTCCAFQRFVMLYVFESREWLNEEYTTVFNKQAASYELFSQLAPGDEVNYKSKSSGETVHYAVFLGCTKDDVTFLDCNYEFGKGVAIVHVRTVTYAELNDSSKNRCYTAYHMNNSKLKSSDSLEDYVNLDPTNILLPIGGTFNCKMGQTLETNIEYSQLTWTSNNSSIAEVDGGVITAKQAGETTVKVKTPNGNIDNITIKVINVASNVAEKWTVLSEEIGGRISCDKSAERATKYATGYYVVKTGSPLYVIRKQTDNSGNVWGFAAGYNAYLDQIIWGWFDLEDKSLGSEQYNYSYYPGKPNISISKAEEGVVRITWNSVNNASHYNIYVNEQCIKSGLTSTTFTYNLAWGDSRTFKIVAVNEAFPCSNVLTVATASDTVLYTMPSCEHPKQYRELREAEQASCSATGYTGDTYCTLCNNKIMTGNIINKLNHNYSKSWISDSKSHWKKCVECGYIENRANHIKGAEATETSSQNCTICNYVIVPILGHSHLFNDRYGNDEYMHWKLCICGQKENIENHQWDKGIIKEVPTIYSEGKKVYTCTLCKYTSVQVLDKLEASEEIESSEPPKSTSSENPNETEKPSEIPNPSEIQNPNETEDPSDIVSPDDTNKYDEQHTEDISEKESAITTEVKKDPIATENNENTNQTDNDTTLNTLIAVGVGSIGLLGGMGLVFKDSVLHFVKKLGSLIINIFRK